MGSDRDEIARRLATGRLAGMLFIVGGAASIPANLLFRHPSVGILNHALVGVAIASGLGCLVVPWDRIPSRVFHAIPVVAIAEVAVTVWAAGAHGPVYEWFYVLVAVFAAYAFASRRAIVFHIGLASLAAALPILYASATADQVARVGVMVPMLWVATAAVAQLREGLVARQRELADLARRDSLTGVGNRRLLEERLEQEVARHAREERELAVVVFDLDGFKVINDTLGHPAGDRVLRRVAATLTATVRAGDTVSRHGGDEFCVVAPETGATEALVLVRRLTAALEPIDVLGAPLTASTGVAIFPRDGLTPELLLASADADERRQKADLRDADEAAVAPQLRFG